MAEKIESEDGKLDLVKWTIVAAIVAASAYGNSYFSTESLLFRTIGLLVAAGGAGWIATQTVKGRAFVKLCLEARIEINKVVWPTRQETTQTTLIVVVAVFLVGLLLWGLDSLLSFGVQAVIG